MVVTVLTTALLYRLFTLPLPFTAFARATATLTRAHTLLPLARDNCGIAALYAHLRLRRYCCRTGSPYLPLGPGCRACYARCRSRAVAHRLACCCHPCLACHLTFLLLRFYAARCGFTLALAHCRACRCHCRLHAAAARWCACARGGMLYYAMPACRRRRASAWLRASSYGFINTSPSC